MTASVTHGRALRYAGGSARGLLHHHPGHCRQMGDVGSHLAEVDMLRGRIDEILRGIDRL